MIIYSGSNLLRNRELAIALTTRDPYAVAAVATFGGNLLAVLEAKKLSQAAFARAVGRPASTVSNWVKSRYRPDTITLLLWAKTLGVSVETFFAGVDKDYDHLLRVTSPVSPASTNVSTKAGADAETSADLSGLTRASEKVEAALATVAERLGDLRSEVDRATAPAQKRKRG